MSRLPCLWLSCPSWPTTRQQHGPTRPHTGPTRANTLQHGTSTKTAPSPIMPVRAGSPLGRGSPGYSNPRTITNLFAKLGGGGQSAASAQDQQSGPSPHTVTYRTVCATVSSLMCDASMVSQQYLECICIYMWTCADRSTLSLIHSPLYIRFLHPLFLILLQDRSTTLPAHGRGEKRLPFPTLVW